MNYELLLKLHIRRKPTDGLVGKFGQQPQVVEAFQRTVQATPIDDGSRLMEIDVRMPLQLIINRSLILINKPCGNLCFC